MGKKNLKQGETTGSLQEMLSGITVKPDDKTVKPAKESKKVKSTPKVEKEVKESTVPLTTQALSIDSSKTYERLELRRIGGQISVYYRPNHCYLTTVEENDEGLAILTKYLKMTREEFTEVLKTLRTFSISEMSLKNALASSSESWWENAWSYDTKKVLLKIELENPVELPILISK